MSDARAEAGIFTTLLLPAGRGVPPQWSLHLGRLQVDAMAMAFPPVAPTALAPIIARLSRWRPGPVRLRLRWALASAEWRLHATWDGAPWRLRPPHGLVLAEVPGAGDAGDADCDGDGNHSFARGAKLWRDAAPPSPGATHRLLHRSDGVWLESDHAALVAGRDDGAIVTPPALAGAVRSTTVALWMAAGAPDGGADLAEAQLTAASAADLRWAATVNAVGGAQAVLRIGPMRLRRPPATVLRWVRGLVDGEWPAARAVEGLRNGRGPAWAVAAQTLGSALWRDSMSAAR